MTDRELLCVAYHALTLCEPKLEKHTLKVQEAIRLVSHKLSCYEAYDSRNPLGGPAKVFYAMGDAIRAGDSYESVLRLYGYAETTKKGKP